MTNIESLEKLTLAVESAGVDIAPSYADYLRLALAIATDCGEQGRDCFHRLCRLHSDYDSTKTDRMFDHVLKSHQNRVHLGTVFHLASAAGVNVGNLQICNFAMPQTPHTCARINNVNATNADTGYPRDVNSDSSDELIEGSEPMVALPTFPDYDWPEPLKSIMSYGTTPAQRDILLLGAVTVLGATLGKKVRVSYGRRNMSPCLQTFIVAPPASGKGILSFLRQFADPVHDELRSHYESEMKAYKEEKVAYDSAGNKRQEMEVPEKPLNRMFLIAGNNSGTGILQNIMDSGGKGLIFEVEADTLSTAIGADFGKFSDTLRKFFDHERISYNRRTDQEYREIKNTYMGVLLSGTPAQVRPLIPSTENGLFSRQLFYYMPAIRSWRDQFDFEDSDLEDVFHGMGKEWKAFLDSHKSTNFFTLELTKEQKDVFNECFDNLYRHAGIANGNEMNSSVVRLAINVCRIMSVIALLRGVMKPAEDLPKENVKDGFCQRMVMSVTPEDFNAVISLIRPLYHHATHILSFLPSSDVNRRNNSDRDSLFSLLPEKFTLQMVKEKAQLLKLNEQTAFSWVYRLERLGKISKTDLRGEFTFSRTHV